MPMYWVAARKGKGKVIEAKNLKGAIRKGIQIYGRNLFVVKREAKKGRDYESYYIV